MKDAKITKTLYVLGFIFDPKLEKVLLINKNRPTWQKGKFNGIGGHIEEGEDNLSAIKREVWEETGLKINNWQVAGKMSSEKWDIYVFTTKLKTVNKAVSKTDELISIHPTSKLPKEILPNLGWLIEFCRDRFISDQLSHFDVWYNPGKI